MKYPCALLFSTLVSGLAYGNGNVDVIQQGAVVGWACAPNSDEPQTIYIRGRNRGAIAQLVANIPREDGVRIACGSNTSAHGFSYSWAYLKILILGPGVKSNWDFLHVYRGKGNGTLEELPGSPKNVYMGQDGVPLIDFDPQVWPPQDSSSAPVASKSPPITVWPGNKAPTGIPTQPAPSWPCGLTCSSSASGISRLNMVEPGRLDYQADPISSAVYSLDDEMKKVVRERVNDMYEKLKSIDVDVANQYLDDIEF